MTGREEEEPWEVLRVLPPGKVEEKAPTAQQLGAVSKCLKWLAEALEEGKEAPKKTFTLAGIAGAGKTFTSGLVIQGIRRRYPHLRIAYLGTTHQARIQLGGSITDATGEVHDARTVWSAVFHTGSRYFCVLTPADEDGRHETVEPTRRSAGSVCAYCAATDARTCQCLRFEPCSLAQAGHHAYCNVDEEPEANAPREEYPFGPVDLFYVDEGSVLTREQIGILLSWGALVVVVGDNQQLEPVQKGKPRPEKGMCDQMHAPDAFLDQPQRQDPGSALFRLASAFRNGEAVAPAQYADDHDIAVLAIPDTESDDPVTQAECVLFAQRIAEFGTGWDRVVITPWKSVRQRVNRILHEKYHPGGKLMRGEHIRCLKPYTRVYRVDGHEALSMEDIGVYHDKWMELTKARERAQRRLMAINREMSAVFNGHAQGSIDELRDEKETLTDQLARIPQDTRKKTVVTGQKAIVERVQEDHSGDCRVLYAVLKLDDGFDWPALWPRAVVRLAADQLGFLVPGHKPDTWRDRLTRSETPPDATLWDYSHCLTAHGAQGGEWNTVMVLCPGWPGVIRRMGYVAVTRAKKALTLIGDQRCTERQMLRLIDLVSDL